MKIAVLLTCHNRREKTVRCLESLLLAIEFFNEKEVDPILAEIFLVDDGCTDGTADAVRELIGSKFVLHLLRGNGSLYWAGGMRYCWEEAIKRHIEWDFYLLLNDDVTLFPTVFHELLEAHNYSVAIYHKEGIYSGITCAPDNHDTMTYGGNVWINRLLAKSVRLEPTGKPQVCDVTNANILLVSKSVVDKIGIFYKGYAHGSADQDYSWFARKKGLPVLLTSGFCGECPYDHKDSEETRKMIMDMNFKERKAYFQHPLHSSKEQILSEWRMTPFRAPMTALGRLLILCFPRLYYRVNKLVR